MTALPRDEDKVQVAIIGAGRADDNLFALACRTGYLAAARSWTVLCGGMGGVMEGASKGAHEGGGVVVGILPGRSKGQGNRYLTVALPTGMGEGRNVVIAQSADVLIAIGGEYGTLSEMALGLKMGKTVISLRSWVPDTSVLLAESPEEAITLAARALELET